MRLRTFCLAMLLPALPGCVAPRDQAAPVALRIESADLAPHIERLASDAFEGRAPSSPGERRTIEYLRAEFERIGLQPGNGDSFFQEVPLVAITADPGAVLHVGSSDLGVAIDLSYADEMMVWTTRVSPRESLDESELVFVGYGIVAPEYGWNDYEDLDVRGKTVVVLVNDPGFATEDAELFDGRSMTYYGRWTYKYEEAARQGAAGVLIVHEDAPAAYPWAVVSGSWSGPQFHLAGGVAQTDPVAVEGWITVDAARRVFASVGMDYDEARQTAGNRGFQARSLGASASVTLDNVIAQSVSNNVLARLPGSQRPGESIVYVAHWDHLGLDPSLPGDKIYNGARDNATGVAGLLAIASAFARLDRPPERSIVFLAATAEESGLLGSEFYTANPVYPLPDTVAVFNMDGLNVDGPTHDVTVIGHGKSELELYLARVARRHDREVRPDPSPEKGSYYRSDHINFARQGVPALYADEGVDSRAYGETWGRDRSADYTENRYHKPSDEFDPSWNLEGAAEDLQLLFEVGLELSREASFPNWLEGDEFRAIRDTSRSR